MKWGCGRGWEGGERGGWNGAEGRGAKGYMKNEGGCRRRRDSRSEGRIGESVQGNGRSSQRIDGTGLSRVEMTVAASGRERVVKGEGTELTRGRQTGGKAFEDGRGG